MLVTKLIAVVVIGYLLGSIPFGLLVGKRMAKVDVTQGGNPLQERLLKQYGVKGVPTVVFLDIHGKEWKGLRLVDFLPPEPFLNRMVQLRPDNRS